MNAPKSISLGAVLLLLCLYLNVPAHAAEICHRPAPHTLITWFNRTHPQAPLHYDPRNSAIYHPISILRTDQPPAYWIGLAWLAPESGALFAIKCDGSVMDASAVGAIGKLSAGPRLPQLGQTVVLVYLGKETRECVHDEVQIVGLRNNKIISLWQHGYRQGLNVTVNGRPRSFLSENYTLDFAEHGLTLRLRGVRASYAYLRDGSQASVPSATETLEAETWRWDSGRLRFVPEKPYKPLPVCVAK